MRERGAIPRAIKTMTEQAPVNQAAAKIALPDAQDVTAVRHYTDRLFSFRTTRPQSLRFRSGEFVMIGLMGDPDPKRASRNRSCAPTPSPHQAGTTSSSSTRSRCRTAR